MIENPEAIVQNAFQNKEPVARILVLAYGPNGSEKSKALSSLWELARVKEENSVLAIQELLLDQCREEGYIEADQSKDKGERMRNKQVCFISNRIAEQAIAKGFNVVWDINNRSLCWIMKMCNLARSRGFLLLSLEPQEPVFHSTNEFLSSIVDRTFYYPQTGQDKAYQKEATMIASKFERGLEENQDPFCVQSYADLKVQKKRFKEKFSSYLSSIEPQ